MEVFSENKFNMISFIKKIKIFYENCNAPILRFKKQMGDTPYMILISALLSSRTKDDITGDAVKRLFSKAKTPEEMSKLKLIEIEKTIYPVGFYRRKSVQIIEISRIIIDKYSGKVPNKIDLLLNLPGIGRKTANLILSECFGIPSICVDTHVHKISNRIGYLSTNHPNETEIILKKIVPKMYWANFNKYLVAFGQTICLSISPVCSKCFAFFICMQVGVIKFR